MLRPLFDKQEGKRFFGLPYLKVIVTGWTLRVVLLFSSYIKSRRPSVTFGTVCSSVTHVTSAFIAIFLSQPLLHHRVLSSPFFWRFEAATEVRDTGKFSIFIVRTSEGPVQSSCLDRHGPHEPVLVPEFDTLLNWWESWARDYGLKRAGGRVDDPKHRESE